MMRVDELIEDGEEEEEENERRGKGGKGAAVLGFVGHGWRGGCVFVCVYDECGFVDVMMR